MSQAFVSGVERHFPKAHITFDRFHLMKVLNEAMDEVRREEAKTRPELAKSRYTVIIDSMEGQPPVLSPM